MKKNYSYPSARRADVVDNYHGTLVTDPYRWLEEPDSEETQAWVTAENELTHQFLEELPCKELFNEKLTALWNYPRYSTPIQRGSKYLFHKNSGLQNQAALYQQTGLDGTPDLLLDPNTLSEDGTTALVQDNYSPDGRFLAYALAEHGSDWNQIHVYDIDKREELSDIVRWVKFSAATWLPDNSGFYYSRYPAPDEMPDTPPSTHQRVYLHRLGSDQSEDELIYARPDAPDLGFQPQVTDDGRYLILTVWEGTDRRTRIYYRSLHSKGEFVLLQNDFDARYEFIDNIETVFYFLTDLDADNGRIIAIDIEQPARENWREIVPPSQDVIDLVQMVNNQLVLSNIQNAHNQLLVYQHDGTFTQQIELPTLGAVWTLSGKRTSSELFFNFQSFLYPPTIFRYDFTTNKLSIFRQAEVAFDPTRYETNQVFCISKDGTRVPIFLTHKKDLERNANHPTLLYGYGGFTVNLLPIFSPGRIAWLEMGGIYAQANLRGGNEFGEKWHAAGMLADKQNVFDDFIGAAEWLIDNDYTQPAKLAIEGGSNGGLLVAACLLQRPFLFGAVHCAVPVADMLRYHKFTAGRYWTGEYGNAEENPEHFDFLHAYSPLHNAKNGTTYPPTLITTADTDDRVVPMHAKKFAATLQAADSGHNPILIRIETKAGHGLGKPTGKRIAEATDVYAFLWTMLAG